MSINQRIKYIISIKVKNQTDLAKQLNVKAQLVSKWCTDGGSVGLETINKLVVLFNDLNARWLLTGEGEPFAENAPETGNACMACSEKERLIKQLQDQLNDKERIIKMLEGNIEGKENRKAC